MIDQSTLHDRYLNKHSSDVDLSCDIKSGSTICKSDEFMQMNALLVSFVYMHYEIDEKGILENLVN